VIAERATSNDYWLCGPKKGKEFYLLGKTFKLNLLASKMSFSLAIPFGKVPFFFGKGAGQTDCRYLWSKVVRSTISTFSDRFYLRLVHIDVGFRG
jgi:hypothetical protein